MPEPIGPGDIGAAVAKAIPAFFSDAINQFGVGGPAYLATGEPQGIVAQVGQAVGRSACRRYAAGIDGLSSSAGQQYEEACRPYLDTLDPGNGIEFATPFFGGQCDAQLYLGSYTVNVGNIPPGTPRTVFFRAFGPIGGVVTSGEAGSQTTGLRCRGALQREGTPFACGAGPPTLVSSRVVNFFSGGTQRGGSISSLTPCGLDNCGDPPPGVTQPDPFPDPQPPPFRFNPAPNIDIPINVDIGPDGDITVDFGGDPFEVSPFEPDPTDPGGGGGEPAPQPSNGPNENGAGDAGAVGGAGPENDDGDFAPPGEGRAYVGAFVEFTVPPGIGNIPSANPSNPAYATVIGNVCLDHNGVFSAATQVRSRWIGVFRDNPNLTVRGVRVNTRPGVSFRVYPVSVETCPENTCPVPGE